MGQVFAPWMLVTVSLLALFLWLPQVLTETSSEDLHAIAKRNVGVLARTGQLPYSQGKRSFASLARTGNLPLYLQKKLHPGMTNRNQASQEEQNEKRYLGALVRQGNLPYQFHAKRDSLMDSHDEDELEELKTLEAETKALETVLYLESQLNLELLKEKILDGVLHDEELEDGEVAEEKRSMASLARTGNLPLKRDDEKRSVEALARAGYLPATPKTMAARNDNSEEVGKRSVATLARNGQLRAAQQEGKRGGIGALARQNLLPQKKDADNLEELEELIQEMIEEEKEKRNIGSVARSFNLPSNGKRNLGALAKGGGYARYAKSGIEDYTNNEEKRNLASLVRSRLTPLHEGKRMSPMVSAKMWQRPAGVYGKRPDMDYEESNVETLAKRYVAALLRHGPLPVGSDENTEPTEASEKEGDKEKRHIGSVKSSVHKRSIETPTTDNHGRVHGGRAKREAYMMPSANEEYPMANVQNSDLFDYDDLLDQGQAPPEKRFLEVDGSGIRTEDDLAAV